MPSVVMNIRYVGQSAIKAQSHHEKHRTPDGASAIDPERSRLNKVLRGPATQSEALERLWSRGVKPPATQSETPYVQMVLSASPEFFRDPGQGPGQWNDRRMKEWAKKTFEWLRDEYGADLVHASIHLDEDTPHIHALIVPTYQKKPRKPGRQKRGETLEEFEARKAQAENAETVRTVGRSSNETWRKSFARRDARRSYHKAVEGMGIEYGQDFLAEGMPSPDHKTTGTWVKEQAAKVAAAEIKTQNDRNRAAAALNAERDASRAEIARDRAEIAEDRDQIEKDRAEVRGVMRHLNGLLDQAEVFLRRPDLPALARRAGAALMKAAGRPVPEQPEDQGGSGIVRRMLNEKKVPSAPAQKPSPEAGSLDGPGM